MTLKTILRAVLLALLTAGIGVCADKPQSAYHDGTITKNFTTAHKFYDLKGIGEEYQINNCGEFQTGQVVQYRADDTKVFIRREDGKEQKCSVESKTVSSTPPVNPYQKGTITGYESRLDTWGMSRDASKRREKVYELKGPDMLYKVGYCGAFQTGKFIPGETVEYRVEGERLYIRHDEDKEYGCKIEGSKTIEDAKPAEGAPPAKQ